MHSRFPAPGRRPRAGAQQIPPPPLEALERRAMLAGTPAPEAQVNTHTRDHQRYPAIAADADGDYVVTWESYQQEDTDWNIYARRFAADGTPLGAEFRVNQDTSSYHSHSSVAMDDSGNFVVSWTQGPVGQVLARRFFADGAPREDEFVVEWTSGAGTSSVAVDADGDFAVAWDVADEATGRRNVFAQLYTSGLRRWGVQQVNTNLAGSAWKADVAMDDDGHFAVAFEVGEDEALGGTYVRKYTNTSLALLPETRVNSGPASAAAPAVAMGADGGFVVAWGEASSVYAKRFHSFGVQEGGAILVGSASAAQALDVTAGASRDFVVTWAAAAADGQPDVFGRGFTPGGTPLSAPFRLNSHTVSQQTGPAAAMADDGGFVATWSSWGQDGDLTGVFSREFDAATPPPSTVVGRRVFYNRSAYDNGSVLATAADDGAIAGQKMALLPGGTPSFLNVTNYTRGINGVMVDVADLPAGSALNASDFSFRSGETADRSTWSAGPAPAGVSTRQVAPGRHRVTLTWREYNARDESGLAQAVANGWLEVTLKASPRTGLAVDDVFSFGNLIGETGSGALTGMLGVTAFDAARVRAAQLASGASVNNPYDFNRDGRVNVVDAGIARSRGGAWIALPNIVRLTATTVGGAPVVAPATARVSVLRGEYVDPLLA